MVVLVNLATSFTVTIYGIKRRQFNEIAKKIVTAIQNTLLAMPFNPEVVDEYIKQAGDIKFVANKDRKAAACATRQGLNAAFVVGRAINESAGAIKYNDTLGGILSHRIVNYSKSYEDAYHPSEKMIEALEALTGKPAYRYRAFELLVTLDLEAYKAERRLIVPADLELTRLHKALESVYRWQSYHLYDFTILDKKGNEPIARLVPTEEDLEYEENATLLEKQKLSDYMPLYPTIIYTYDMGDNWEHKIELVRVIDDYDKESPYLLEAHGQAPPEDVGGVGGFLTFRAIMLDPQDSEHERMKRWAGYWSPELWDWESRPHAIH